MNNKDYLEHSAKEPMALLRKKFNNGEDIYKTSPTTLTAEEASADTAGNPGGKTDDPDGRSKFR